MMGDDRFAGVGRAADLAEIKRKYRDFAERECRGYSDVYYELALAVSGDEEMAEFLAAMPVAEPNLFLASVQFLTGVAAMPRAAPTSGSS